jgi:membrane-bound metal-dependent hydrolase YbcI (DUF457 family)
VFVGHLAVGLAAKHRAPAVSLGWFIAAVTLLDLIWPILVILGVETVSIVPGATAFTPLIFDSYPWTHSLVMSVVWGLVFVAIARWRGVPTSIAPLLVMLVVSHWVLDFISHAPDMPLWPGNSPRLGLGLWNSIPLTLLIEGAIWLAGIAIYVRTKAARGERPRWPFWSLIGLCTVMWITSPYQSPPPSVRALGWFALIGWIVVPWAAWADRPRRS